MSDDAPISYLAVADGTPVVTADGARLGEVEHVLQDDRLDFFDGLVVATRGGRRFLAADRIASMTRSVVTAALTADEADHLPEPSGDGVFTADPAEDTGPGLSAWFGRLFGREHWTQREDDPGERR